MTLLARPMTRAGPGGFRPSSPSPARPRSASARDRDHEGGRPVRGHLAGFLIWSGVVLVLTTQYSTVGIIRLQDDTLIGIANDFLSEIWGWILGAVIVGLFAFSQLSDRDRAAGARARREAPRSRGSTNRLPGRGRVPRRLLPEPGSRDPEGRADPRSLPRLLVVHRVADALAATSTPSGGAPRPRGGPASTSIASGSPST